MSAPYETGNAEASSSTLLTDPLAGRLPLQPLASHSHPDAGEHDFTEEQVDEYREQDRFLPIANVARIMRESLPTSAKIAKESKECLQECVSEFISFITSEASERCKIEKRKTMNGEDILDAMQALGFDNYVEALKVYLAKYRISQVNKPKRSSKAGKSKAQTEGSSTGIGLKQEEGDDEDDDSDSSEDDAPPPATTSWSGGSVGGLSGSDVPPGLGSGERDSKRVKLE